MVVFVREEDAAAELLRIFCDLLAKMGIESQPTARDSVLGRNGYSRLILIPALAWSPLTF